MPDLATKTDLKAELDALEHRLTLAIERQTLRIVGAMTGIVGLLDAILFVLLRFVH